ncbi:MAG: LysM peptidoglycan-binding domain-containing protein [Candidatus Cohnella colombiensis]|uniref:LysM peptidoglycan-binding domain-containing protein n=1 Tax=Candidatus Cohnella colombiensis TaxID=3121368 RepID=A0AA95EZF7_9BACL|nr:MAG: LysM peptidoglycan-binding domain-containing protein [Cohnella sp.]
MVNVWVLGEHTSASANRKHTTFYRAEGIATRNRQSYKKWGVVRSVCMMFAFLILFSGFTLVRTYASSSEVIPASIDEVVISVDSGDTLWGLASIYKKSSMDTREAVHTLMKRNGLTSSQLSSGQSIIVPSLMLE